jgi:hypothetical protein
VGDRHLKFHESRDNLLAVESGAMHELVLVGEHLVVGAAAIW